MSAQLEAGQVGTTVLFAERGELTGARVVGREGSRYVLENLIGERFAVAQPRLFWIGRSATPTHEALVAWWNAVGALAARVDLAAAWQALDDGHLPCEPAIVAVRALPEADGPDAARIALAEEAVAFAVFANATWFRVRDRQLVRASAAELAETRRKKAEKEAAQRALQRAVAVFEARLSGEPPTDDADEVIASWRGALIDVAAKGRESEHWARASTLCEGLGTSCEKAFDLLVRLGELDPYANLAVYRAGIRLTFAAEELAEAERLASHRPSPSHDLAGLEAIAIDDADTTDVDDALALVGARVYVMISDVAAWVQPGSVLDRAAAERATTVYLPEGKLPMLPTVLSDGTLSLSAGARVALVFSFEIGPDGRLKDLEIKRARVTIARRVSYEEADRLLADPTSGPFGPLLQRLQVIADRHRAWRNSRGAVSFQRPEVQFELDRDGRVVFKLGDPFGPARQLVQELMIAACAGVAVFCAENQIPCIYRAQSPPDDPPRAGEVKDGRIDDPHLQYELLRRLKPSTLQLEVAPHWTLGVPAYTQVTSPIRRYADLLMHQQLTTFLKTGRPLYPATKLQAHLFELGRRSTLVRRVEQESRRFFALRYLEQNPGQILTGTVLREIGKKTLFELAPLALSELVQLRRRRSPGSTVRFEVIAADARADTVQLKELAG